MMLDCERRNVIGALIHKPQCGLNELKHDMRPTNAMNVTRGCIPPSRVKTMNVSAMHSSEPSRKGRHQALSGVAYHCPNNQPTPQALSSSPYHTTPHPLMGFVKSSSSLCISFTCLAISCSITVPSLCIHELSIHINYY